LSGEVQFSINFRYCKEHGASEEPLISLVNRICPAGRNFDSKIMVAIGILRWYFNYQREEIKNILFLRGISISTGKISNLSEEFLVRFYALHKRHVPKMKSLFEKNGGMRLHLDGTGEAGNEIVFMAKEGATGITLDAQTITTENKKYVKIFLQALNLVYGKPIVIVRDMSKQIRDAATDIFPTVPHQICHYHFVKNLGNLIFKDRYAAFRKDVVNKRILSQLKRMKTDVCKRLCRGSENTLVVAERKWVTLAIEHLLICRERSSNYPFVLPYLEIMERILMIQRLNLRIFEWNLSHNLECREIIEFSDKLESITCGADVNIQYANIKTIWNWFEKIRAILRVGRHLSQNGCETTTPGNTQKMNEDLMVALSDIENEGVARGGELNRVARQMINNCKNHADELFVEVRNHLGNVVEIARDNNLEERGHRWSRMHIRRRTGRTRTTNEMAHFGALTAIFSNMENEMYVKEVFSDVKDFIREMQDISQEEIRKSRILIKPYASKKMVHSDVKRSEFLENFVALLEDGCLIGGWIFEFKISNPILTP